MGREAEPKYQGWCEPQKKADGRWSEVMGDNEILARFGPSIDAEFEIDELPYGQLEAWNGSENQSTA